MKVGDYVRTKNGSIGKIVDIKVYYVLGEKEKDEYIAVLFENDYIPSIVLKTFIIKNGSLIDILEVGDYVNGEEVVRIEKDPFIKGQIDLWTNRTTVNEWGDIGLSPIIDKNIKSIVTKEQFSSMEYKVGELDER